jgi:hypothetical protein
MLLSVPEHTTAAASASVQAAIVLKLCSSIATFVQLTIYSSGSSWRPCMLVSSSTIDCCSTSVQRCCVHRYSAWRVHSVNSATVELLLLLSMMLLLLLL